MKTNYYNPLFDPPPTPKEATDEAVERVRENADDDWMERAEAAVIAAGKKSELSARWGKFTTDDVWDILGDDKPHEPRAMGAVMRNLSKQKVLKGELKGEPLIKATQDYQLSRRPECHSRPIRVWMYQGEL